MNSSSVVRHGLIVKCTAGAAVASNTVDTPIGLFGMPRVVWAAGDGIAPNHDQCRWCGRAIAQMQTQFCPTTLIMV